MRPNWTNTARSTRPVACASSPSGTSSPRHQRALIACSWALKEAAYKAMYPTVTLTWKDASVSRHDRKPVLVLAPTLHCADLVGPIHCSVSHDGDYVLAMVAVERRS